jgi:hypothetical protein
MGPAMRSGGTLPAAISSAKGRLLRPYIESAHRPAADNLRHRQAICADLRVELKVRSAQTPAWSEGHKVGSVALGV